MLLCDSLTATATREAILFTLVPSAKPLLEDAFHGYLAIFQGYDEIRRWLY